MKKNLFKRLIMQKGRDKVFHREYFFYIFVFVMFIYVMAGCKVKSLVSKTKENYTNVEQIINVNRINEGKVKKIWIKKIRGVYTFENEELHFNSNIRIIKDSIIIVSIATAFGIEAMRIYFEKDSITIINRFNKTWYAKSIKEHQDQHGISYDLVFMENILLMGINEKLLYEMGGENKAKNDDNNYCYIRNEKKRNDKEEICFDTSTGYLRQRKLEVPFYKIELLIEYSGYKETNSYILPDEVNTRFSINEKVHRIMLYYDRVIVNETFPAKIKVNNSYQRVDRLLDL